MMDEKKQYTPTPIPQTEAELASQLDPYFTKIEKENRQKEAEAAKSNQVKMLEKSFRDRVAVMKSRTDKAFRNYEKATSRGEKININYLKDEILKIIGD